MNTTGASRALPIILTAITLATALFFYKQREVLRQKTQELLSQSSKQTAVKPTESVEKPVELTPFPTSVPTPTSQTNESNPSLAMRDLALPDKTTTTIICTPVYGMANTCVEHVVVDTALDTSIFYNLAGLSYFTGLAAFIKAKKRA